MRGPRLRIAAALMMLPFLSGCIAAAAAVPVMTATGILTQRKREPAPPTAPTPVPQGTAAVATRAQPQEPLRAEAGPGVTLTNLTALPAPTGAGRATGDPWRAFTDYALARHNYREQGNPVQSALLAPGSAATLEPSHNLCTQRDTGVLVDLDAQEGVFAPAATGPTSPGLAESLARLRQAGIVVLWISRLDANRVGEVAEALKRTGLDPAGRDPILLARNPGERKQVMRRQADQNVCVVALAGDVRGDFDELFDYLRDPNDAYRFDPLLGAGWFLVPEPLTGAPAAP